MKKVYNKIIKILERIIIGLHKLKMIYSEYYALCDKTKLINQIKWSEIQQKEFDEFWFNNYGKKITSKGHRLYESINGVYNKDYFPDFLFAIKLEPKLNNLLYSNVYSDKSLTELLYAKCKNLTIPKTYFVNSGGVLYDERRRVASMEIMLSQLSETNKYIIKPSIGGNSGKGITFIDNKITEQELSDILISYKDDYIIQEILEQHISFASVYPNSINTIRIITYIANNAVHNANLVMRIGQGGSKVDNIHSGGIAVGVRDNGEMMEEGYVLGYSDTKSIIYKHPDTQVVFKNHQLSSIREIIQIAKELHGYTPRIGIISWDFMVNKESEPVLIEANYMGQSIWFTQIIHKTPFFREHTKSMLKLIRK